MTGRGCNTGNGNSNLNGPAAGSGTGVMPDELVRGEHWWNY